MPEREEQRYDLTCYTCSKVFSCSRREVTTVIDPPKPLCDHCRKQFRPRPAAQAELTRYYGNGPEIPGWNKPLRGFVEAVEACRVHPKYLTVFPDKFRSWIAYDEPLKDSHPKRCLCGKCEVEKQATAKPPSKELQAVVAAVDLAMLRSFLPEET